MALQLADHLQERGRARSPPTRCRATTPGSGRRHRQAPAPLRAGGGPASGGAGRAAPRGRRTRARCRRVGRRPPAGRPVRPGRAARSWTRDGAMPQRPAGASAVKGLWVRAQRSKQSVERRGVVAIRGLEPRLGHAGRRAGPEGVAIAGHVLDRDPSTLARQPQLDDASVLGQPGQGDLDLGQVRAGCHLIGPQVADPSQQVVQPVHSSAPDGRRPAPAAPAPGLSWRQGRAARAAPPAPSSSAQQLAVEREGLRPTLGQRRVALVQVGADVVEQQPGREWRGRPRSRPRPPGWRATGSRPAPPCSAGTSKTSLQDLAIRLQDDREGAVAAGHGQQVGRALALHPQRRALARPSARQQQRPRSVLAEMGGEQGRAAKGAHQDVVDLVRAEQNSSSVGRLGDFGQAQGDAVVGPDGLRPDAPARPSAPRWPCAHGACTRPPNGRQQA